MKVSLRVLLVLAALFAAYLSTIYVASFTGVPLGNGGKEGTPSTVVAIFTVFPLSLIAVLVIGNIAINRYFRLKPREVNHRDDSRRDTLKE
jgi:hypothetical protein